MKVTFLIAGSTEPDENVQSEGKHARLVRDDHIGTRWQQHLRQCQQEDKRSTETGEETLLTARLHPHLPCCDAAQPLDHFSFLVTSSGKQFLLLAVCCEIHWTKNQCLLYILFKDVVVGSKLRSTPCKFSQGQL